MSAANEVPVLLPRRVRAAATDKLAAITLEQAEQLAGVLRAAGYNDDGVAARFGSLETRGRGAHNLPRLAYLTREPGALNTLIRLFLLGLCVPAGDAAAALAPLALDDLTAAELLERQEQSVYALVRIFPFDRLLVLFDPPELLEYGAPEDFVSGMTNSTSALLCCMIGKPSRATLDIGTGTGALAFFATRFSRAVMATDVAPRALAMARLNAWLNGLGSIEFDLGSGFEPAAGRKFDLVVSNPPFILGPLTRYTFRDTGAEQDGLCRRLVADAPAYLEEGGFFQCQLEWPERPDEEWTDRFRAWLQDTGCDALVLRMAVTDALRHAEGTAVDMDVNEPETQIRLFESCADYFAEQGIVAVGRGFIFMRRRTHGAPNWIQFEDVSLSVLAPLGDVILRVFETHDRLDAMTPDALLDACPRLARGVIFENGREWDGAVWSVLEHRMLQTTGLRLKAKLDARMATLLQGMDGVTPLRQILEAAATGMKMDVRAIVPAALAMMRGMLVRGFFTIE